jgi:exportin-1
VDVTLDPVTAFAVTDKLQLQAQREGIKHFVSSRIVALSQTDESMASERVELNKLDRVLVGILKQEWPHNWPTFISDIVGLSKTSEVSSVLQLISLSKFAA